MSNKNFRIGLLDSGAGGLSVLKEIMKQVPEAAYYYICDNSFYPYGELKPSVLLERVMKLCQKLVRQEALDLFVIPCNTASSIVLVPLRRELDIPVVGVVPAVKVAAELSQSKHFAVLATKGTIQSSYLTQLINSFAKEHSVLKKASHRLVDLSEQKLRGKVICQETLASELSDIFYDQRIDSVVLGCTHYSHLLPDLVQIQPRPIHWIDSRVAVANRVSDLLCIPKMKTNQNQDNLSQSKLTIFYTSALSFTEEQKFYWGKTYSTEDFRLFHAE